MKISLLIVFIFSAILCSCKSNTKSRALNNEYAVINLALQNAVIPDDEFKDYFVEGYNPKKSDWLTDDEREEREHNYDSIKSRYDTVRTSLIIKDTLYQFPVYEIDKYRKNNPIGKGIKDFALIRQIAGSVNTNAVINKLDISQIDPVYNYRTYFRRLNEDTTAVQLYRGTIRVVKPCFNRDSTMACICIQLKCGNPCGYMKIFFMTKNNNNWALIYHTITSVY